jgi:hypothetical protein
MLVIEVVIYQNLQIGTASLVCLKETKEEILKDVLAEST